MFLVSIAFILNLSFINGLSADPVANFYRGKTIRVIVGYSPGGGYDRYTRLIAKHMSQHIPGNPDMVVENKTGAASQIAANYLYGVAENNGLTIGVFNAALTLQKAIGNKSIEFDPRRFSWIGAPSRSHSACFIMGFVGLDSLEEIVQSGRVLRFGATRVGSGSNPDTLPNFLNLALHTKIKLVPGYKGTAKIRLALQQREVEGTCSSWESYRATAQSMLTAHGDDRLIPFIIDHSVNSPDLKTLNLPDFRSSLAKSGYAETYDLWRLQQKFSRPFAAPPGTPRDRLQALRHAFNLTLTDDQFLAEAENTRLQIEPSTGEAIETMVEEMFVIPKQDKEKLMSIIKPVDG